MAARIDTHKELAGDSEQWLIDNFENVDIDDREWLEEMFQAINIVETASLVKPGANDLEQHVIDWINDGVSEGTYDNPKSAVLELMEYGCKNGLGNLIRTSEQREFLDKYRAHIEVIIEELIDSTGESEFLIRGGEYDRSAQKFVANDFSFDGMHERFAWIGFEETARQLMIECGYEEEF